MSFFVQSKNNFSLDFDFQLHWSWISNCIWPGHFLVIRPRSFRLHIHQQQLVLIAKRPNEHQKGHLVHLSCWISLLAQHMVLVARANAPSRGLNLAALHGGNTPTRRACKSICASWPTHKTQTAIQIESEDMRQKHTNSRSLVSGGGGVGGSHLRIKRVFPKLTLLGWPTTTLACLRLLWRAKGPSETSDLRQMKIEKELSK